MEYLHWNEKTLTDLSEKNISDMYDHGYVFTRIGKGVMHQTRSVRIDLNRFESSSENRRVLKKVEGIDLKAVGLPLEEYDFTIGKSAKDFYETKFGPGIMSAQKVKEMLTNGEKSNFNALFMYTKPRGASYEDLARLDRSEHEEFFSRKISVSEEEAPLGFAVCYMNKAILHYSYPFYRIDKSPKDMGLGMMTMAIERAKKDGLRYIYLGSLQRPTDTYKLQFSGLEWFDGQTWSTDLEKAKKILKQ